MLWDENILILGHRGYMEKYAENSLQGFKKALENGANGFELDVWLTRDGKVIVMHDKSINRTTNMKGKQKQLDLRELKKAKLSNNERIPTLKKIYKEFPHSLINVEIKDPDAVKETISIIEENEAESKTLISSFNRKILRNVRNINGDIRLGILIGNILNIAYIPNLNEDINLYSVNLPIEGVQLSLNVYKRILEWIKSMDLKVALWSMNDELYYRKDNLKKLNGLYDIIIPNEVKKARKYVKELKSKN